MFNSSSPKSSKKSAKTYINTGTLPGYVDLKQPPTKRQPFKAINDVSFAQSVELVLPEELYQMIWQKLDEKVRLPKFSKVILKLQDLLEGEIFNTYIKLGDVVMLSKGRPGLDNMFYLKHGLLRLELDRESYERCGLQGHPIESGGKKHAKSRYCVEVNLRLPSMLHGKKGFERVVWAAKNVLNRSLCWLVVDLNTLEPKAATTEGDDTIPLEKHHPIHIIAHPQSSIQLRTLVPDLKVPVSADEDSREHNALIEDWVYEISEWLGLVGIASPRVVEADSMDPYLSKYSLPDRTPPSGKTLRVLKWQGLLCARWITTLFVEVMKHSRTVPTFEWLAINVRSHHVNDIIQRDGYSIILTGIGTGSDSDPAGEASSPTAVAGTADSILDTGDTQGKHPNQAQEPSANAETTEKGAMKHKKTAQTYTCLDFQDAIG